MAPLLLAVGTFAVWCLIGAAVLSLVGAAIAEPWVALASPIVGSAAVLLPLFFLSHAGVPVGDLAWPVTAVLVIAAVAVIATRRPPIPRVVVVPVVALCLVDAVLLGRPFFAVGFRWLGNGNNDMADYVLSATDLIDHALLGPIDWPRIVAGFDYPTSLRYLHNVGGRPGGEITLAALSALTHRQPYEVFMPFTIALQLCLVCAAASLAAQVTRRWWAAVAAAALLVASPLAAFSVLQQLMPQTWGLAIAAALFAFVMRDEIYRGAGAPRGEIVIVGILVSAFLIAYVELATMLIVVYGVYVLALLVRRRLSLRPFVRLWLPAAAVAVIAVNGYLIREFHYMQIQAGVGVGSTALHGNPPIFGYALVPAALTGVIGLHPLAPSPAIHDASIVAAMVILAAVLIIAVWTAIRGNAASIVLVALAGVGIVLAMKNADRGVFKLFLYVQPFIAAAVGAWLTTARRVALAVAIPLVAALVGAQLTTQQAYVAGSLDPIDVRHAPSKTLLPAFRTTAAHAAQPLVSVTNNLIVAKLQAATIARKQRVPLFFGSFETPLFADAKRSGWVRREFDLHAGPLADTFDESIRATQLLGSGKCELVLPTGSQWVLNRRQLPEGRPDLVGVPCSRPRNLLFFVASEHGQSFFNFTARRSAITLYQLERDPSYAGRTFSGVGRYLLFRVIRPDARMRLVLDLTRSPLFPDTALPKASVVGEARHALDLVGSGSARVFSPPFHAQAIDGTPYVMLDLGTNGRLTPAHRHGIQGLYGAAIPLDPRSLAAYIRDVSLIPAGRYARVRAPRDVRHFPADLADPDLAYSGITEDGWVGRASYVELAGGGSATLLVHADVLPARAQRLRVVVNGTRLATRRVQPGNLDLRVAIPRSQPNRRIELRWSEAVALGPDDPRRAAARLLRLSIVPRRPLNPPGHRRP